MSKGERVTQVIRIAAFVISILLWLGSVIFSVDGFAFQMPKYIWIGYAMAAVVTIIELVFNEEGDYLSELGKITIRSAFVCSSYDKKKVKKVMAKLMNFDTELAGVRTDTPIDAQFVIE